MKVNEWIQEINSGSKEEGKQHNGKITNRLDNAEEKTILKRGQGQGKNRQKVMKENKAFTPSGHNLELKSKKQ